jgi:hypothetical protein
MTTPQQLPNVQALAVDTERTIAERSSLIVISRDVGGKVIQLAPQVVRLEIVQSIRDSGEQRDALVAINKNYCVLLGYKDHPSIPNTDVGRGDLFFFNGVMWEVIYFISTLPGRLMASCDVTP